MLTCRDIATQASDHIDKKLSFRESLSYGMHLLLCAYCRKFVRQLRTSIDVSRQLAIPKELPEYEAEKIVEQTLISSRQQ